MADKDSGTRLMTLRVTPEQETAMEAFFQINNWALIKEGTSKMQDYYHIDAFVCYTFKYVAGLISYNLDKDTRKYFLSVQTHTMSSKIIITT